MFNITTPGRIDNNGEPVAWPWLELIHAANEIEPKFFGEPLFNDHCVEIYEHATVTHNEDQTVTVAAKTNHGNDVLTAASNN